MHAKIQQRSGQIIASHGLVVKCHAGEMEQFVLLVLLVHRVATVIPSGLTIDLRKHVAKCHAGGMEQFVLLVLLVHHVATVIPFGLTNLRKHVAKCHAGELTHVAWKERPAIAAAMVLVGYGSGWVITATKDKGDLGWPDKSGHAKSFYCRLGKSEVWADVRTW